MMKILFIYHNINTKNIRHLPLGLSILSGILKEHGHEVKLLYIQEAISDGALLGYVGEYDPGVIGFSTGTLQWPETVRLARTIKSVFKAPVVCGGPHPTFMPEEVISEPSVDMLCIGEGEYAMLDIVHRLETGGDMASIPNVWVKNQEGRVFRNGVRDLVENLDSLPFPDRSILPYQDIINESKTEPVFITSRGCPYNCTFCSNSAIKKIYKGKGRYVRQRTPENVIAEIGFLKSRYAFETLNFYDEAFGFNREWNRRFCEIYEKEFSMPFGAFIRAETVDRESFRIMKRAGLALIYLGVESGNEEIRRKVMNRKVSNETIINTCRDAQAEGIQVWTFNIVGVPGETVSTIQETMALNRIINPHFASVSIYQPFPGTAMYDECVANHYIEKDYKTNLYEDSVLNLKTIQHHELLEGFRQFQELSNQMKEAHEKRGDRIFLVDL
jgi:radical SAM superfamily enzyme YgiQ (UPF0313 family)